MKLSTTIGESARQTGWARDTVLIYSRLIWCHEIAKRPYRADIGCSSYSLDGTRDTGARVDKESAAESTTVHGRTPLVQRLGGVRRSRALPAFPRIPGCHARRRRDRSRRRHVAASSPASRDPTPGCDPIFDGWIDFGPHPSADQPPQFLAERVLHLPIEEISDLAEAGLLPDAGDVMRPIGSDEAFPDRMDVILRIKNLPEFHELWCDYVENQWNKWAEIERPRRRSIEFYNKIYQIYQRLIALGDDTPIELVFGVGIARWVIQNTLLNIPVIEQLIEIELQEDGSLHIRPRRTAPQLALKAFHVLEIEGSKAVQHDIDQQLEHTVEDPDIGFSPFDKRSFEKILRACAACLSPNGDYHPDTLTDPNDRSLPDADDVLRLTDTWVVYVRQRSGDFRREDIARLIDRVDKVGTPDELPAPAVSFVVEPSGEVLYPSDFDSLDPSNAELVLPEPQSGADGSRLGHRSGRAQTDADATNGTFFFPLPFNDERVEIIRRLEGAQRSTPGVDRDSSRGSGIRPVGA